MQQKNENKPILDKISNAIGIVGAAAAVATAIINFIKTVGDKDI